MEITKKFQREQFNTKSLRSQENNLKMSTLSNGHWILQLPSNKYFLTPHLKCTLFANNSVSHWRRISEWTFALSSVGMLKNWTTSLHWREKCQLNNAADALTSWLFSGPWAVLGFEQLRSLFAADSYELTTSSSALRSLMMVALISTHSATGCRSRPKLGTRPLMTGEKRSGLAISGSSMPVK